MKKLLFLLCLLPSVALADRLGGLNSNAQVALSTQIVTGGNTNYIQNTLTPTTTNQLFNVARGAFTGIDALGAPLLATVESNGVMMGFGHSGAASVNNYIDNQWDLQGENGNTTFARWRVSSPDITAFAESANTDFYVKSVGTEPNILRLGGSMEGLGLGVALKSSANLFFSEATTFGDDRPQMHIDSSWLDSTDATRKACGSFSIYDTSAREFLKTCADGTKPYTTVYGSVTFSAPIIFTSTNAIQNTLTPTTTTQRFSVQTATITGLATISSVTIQGGSISNPNYGYAGLSEESEQFGYLARTLGNPYALALGYNSTVTGAFGTAIGRNATAGVQGVAIGQGSIAGQGATVIGQGVDAGSFSVAMGYNIDSNPAASIAIGTELIGNTGGGNFLFGRFLTSSGFYQHAFGDYYNPLPALNFATFLGGSPDVSTGHTLVVYGNSSTGAGRSLFHLKGTWLDATDATRRANVAMGVFDSSSDITPRYFLSAFTDGTTTYTTFYGSNTFVSSVTINGPLIQAGTGGTAGQVLTSNGVNVAPTWQAANSGSSIYPATATASFPYGFTASSATYSSTVTFNSAIYISTRTNGISGRAAMSGGTATINTNRVTAVSMIHVTPEFAPLSPIGVTARTAGTSFTVTSADGTAAGDLVWLLIEPVP